MDKATIDRLYGERLKRLGRSVYIYEGGGEMTVHTDKHIYLMVHSGDKYTVTITGSLTKNKTFLTFSDGLDYIENHIAGPHAKYVNDLMYDALKDLDSETLAYIVMQVEKDRDFFKVTRENITNFVNNPQHTEQEQRDYLKMMLASINEGGC